MAAVINTNYLSLVAQNNLNKSQSSLGNAIERLSSGLRINSAKDDAAGQAIANRFTANVNGLTQAARNANDGISIAQTTEGALNEINNNLQRIRQLAVQAANGTNSDSDLASVQAEIQQRLDEIDRVSGQTQFNGVNVLANNNKLTIQVGANDSETITIDLKEITSQTLGLEGFSIKSPTAYTASESITSLSAYGPVAISTTAPTLNGFGAGATTDGTVYVDTNGAHYIEVTGSANASENGYYAVAIEDDGSSANAGAITLTNSTVTPDTPAGGTPTAITTVADSRNVPVTISAATQTAIGTGATLHTLVDAKGKDTGLYALQGDDGKLYAANVDKNTGAVSVKTVSYTTADGTAVTGAPVELGGLDSKTEVITVDGKTYNASDVAGHNFQTAKVPLKSIATTKTEDPLAALDAALQKVDTLRSDLGAIQNRFESTIANLNNTVNNLSAARSRIEDADYATEVSNMTKAQILQQAGTSVLAQANQVPQTVLSLLR